jgi:transposase
MKQRKHYNVYIIALSKVTLTGNNGHFFIVYDDEKKEFRISRHSHELYTAEFKAEAIKLVLEESQGITATANQLGIAKQTLSTWVLKTRLAKLADTNQPKLTQSSLEAENKRLKQALARAEMERDILKKATECSMGQRTSSNIPLL